MFDRLATRVLLALAAGAALAAAEPLHSQTTWRTVSSARQRSGERSLNVKVEYGAGRLRVEPSAADLLYRFEMQYEADRVRPVTEYDRATGSLRLAMQEREGRSSSRMRGGHATVNLNADVPVDLNLEFGAGEADLDLGGLSLRRLRLATGASDTRVSFAAPNRIDADLVRMQAGAAQFVATGLGNTHAARFEFEGGVGSATLDFGGAWTRDASAKLEMGVGSLALRFPRGLGVRITKDSFLASFDHADMVKRGDAWYSRNWDSAAHRLTVDIDAAFGSIGVEFTD
ncbi:MAG: hypothetical protein JWM27_1944 [Gemmatimonadetes bacterium]|nr:hypothetical protein [Gemmatimonadota bacterium]